MYLVAIGALEGSSEDTLHALAADLDTTPYELRLLLNAGLPAVVLATVDEKLAQRARAAIVRHGHVPVLLDRRDVVSSAQMVPVREPRFLPEGLVASQDSAAPLQYAEIAVLLKATHRTTSETTQTIKERQLRPVMAIATGGLVISKTVTRSVSSSSVQSEAVLYLFPHGSRTPWLLRERHAHYGGLGTALKPTSLENFAAVVRRLRESAPGARYDERLTSARPMRGVADGIEATDLFAHLLARHLNDGQHAG